MAVRWYNWHGFVVFAGLDVPEQGGVQIEYRNEALDRFFPCCIMPNLTEEELQSPCNAQDWNFATQFLGYVEGYQIRDDRVYWNYPADFDGIPEKKTYTVRLRRLAPGGAVLEDLTLAVTLDPGSTLYLNNWHEWTNVEAEPYTTMHNWRTEDPTDVPAGWYVASDEFGYPRLTAFGMTKLPPVSYCPGVTGRYDVYLGFREAVSEMSVRLPGGVTRDFLLSPRNMPTTRFTKELYLASADFTPADRIEIARRPAAEVNKLRRFGDLLYVKLVPAEPRPMEPPAKLPENFETVFYAEPYSMCYYYYCQDETQAERMAERYCELGVDKVICQSGRVGSRMMHYDSVGGAIVDPAGGDDRQISNGAAEAMQHMNVMKVLAEACRKRGIKFLADIGINSPYKGSALGSRWVEEHEDCMHPRHKLFLDFAREEVREFAATLYAELAELPVDGVAVNCTRYPYGITGEDLVAVLRKFVAKIGAKRRKELEIDLSIVAGLPEFYGALEALLAEDLVDSVCVGRLMSLYPVVDLAPYRKLLDRYPGKKLYGKIDGWLPNHTGLNQSPLPRPADCAELVKAYSGAGADGVFFYQSEQILIDPFLTGFVKSLKLRGAVMKRFRNWAPPGVMREHFTASDFVSPRADGRFESSLGFLMHAIRGIRPKLSFDNVHTREEFFHWRQAVRDKLRELLKMTDRLTVEFKLLSDEKRDGYRLHRYEFYPEEGLAVPMLMLIPDEVLASGKPAPAVICNPGSGAGLWSLAGEPDDNFNCYLLRNRQAWWYCKAGMIGVAVENPATAWNSVEGVEYGQAQSRFFQLLPLAGRTYHGFITEQRLMIVEFLKRHELVDPRRIAVSGLSLGCGGVLYTALMSDDIAAAVYNDFVCSDVQRVLSTTEIASGPNLASARLPGALEWFDIQPDLQAALAPLPLILSEGGPWIGHVEKVVRAYELAGARDRLEVHYYDKYADPASRRHETCDLRKTTGLDPRQYLEFANVDAGQHSFHAEINVPFLCRRFFGSDYECSGELKRSFEEAVRETSAL